MLLEICQFDWNLGKWDQMNCHRVNEVIWMWLSRQFKTCCSVNCSSCLQNLPCCVYCILTRWDYITSLSSLLSLSCLHYDHLIKLQQRMHDPFYDTILNYVNSSKIISLELFGFVCVQMTFNQSTLKGSLHQPVFLIASSVVLPCW